VRWNVRLRIAGYWYDSLYNPLYDDLTKIKGELVVGRELDGTISSTCLAHEIGHHKYHHLRNSYLINDEVWQHEVEAWEYALDHAPNHTVNTHVFEISMFSYIEEHPERLEEYARLLQKYEDKFI
jgi:hypothetical protein